MHKKINKRIRAAAINFLLKLRTIYDYISASNLRLQKISLLKDGIHQFPYFDKEVKFYLPQADVEHIQASILTKNSFYESNLLDFGNRINFFAGDVVDVGANIGNHSLYFAIMSKAMSVVAFEPTPNQIKIFKKNVEINKLKNVSLHECGLGEKRSKGIINGHDPKNAGGIRILNDPAGSIDIKTLDSFKLKGCDFIKVDVEGFEYNVLIGAKKTITKYRPNLWLELLIDQEKIQKTRDLLAEYDYQEVAAFEGENYFFAPAEKADKYIAEIKR